MTTTESPISVATGRPAGAVDVNRVTRAVLDLVESLGFDPCDPELGAAAGRAARTFVEAVQPDPFRLTTFANDGAYDGLVVATSIGFCSLCREHLLPFFGVAHVGYLPAGRIVGLSKLARAVASLSKGFHVQERLTSEIANWLMRSLRPRAVGVVMEARHSCLLGDGGGAERVATVTSALRGILREDRALRSEFLAQVRAAT